MGSHTQTARPDQPLTADEVALVLRLAPSTVRRHLLSGAIHGYKIQPGSKSPWRIPASELRRITGGSIT